MTAVRPRKFPYPYRAMLAISSDCDRSSLESFRVVHRFINTRSGTPMGPGLGLDVADSLWVFKQRASELGLRGGNGDLAAGSAEADELTHYARAGWIDTLHTYGSFPAADPSAFDRRHAEIAIDVLRAAGLRLRVWVNGRGAAGVQNLGPRTSARGDLPGSREFHSDLLLAYGVRYAWDQSAGTAFGLDSVLTPMRLRDGRRLWGFRRHTGEVGPLAAEISAEHGVPLGLTERGDPRCVTWWPHLLRYQLSDEKLDRLVARRRYCVVAQHLCAVAEDEWFPAETVEALRRLRAYQDDGRILVARTSRLLEYQRVANHLEYQIRGDGRLEIDIVAVRDPVIGTFVPELEQLRGITFHVPDPAATVLFLGGQPIAKREIVRSSEDPEGPSVGVRWFAADVSDHVASFRSSQATPASA